MSIRKSWLQVLTLLALAGPQLGAAQERFTALDRYPSGEGGVWLLDTPAKLSVESVPLLDGLSELHRASGVNLVFSPSLLPVGRVVTCLCDSLSVGDALREMLLETELVYVERGGHVVVRPRVEPPPVRLEVGFAGFPAPSDPGPVVEVELVAPQALTGTLTGTVAEAGSRRPLGGAQVFVVGTGVGALSNNAGRFLLLNVPAGEQTVRVEMIGYGTAEATVTMQTGQTLNHDFSLQIRAVALDELVATGTAQATERRRIGNTMSVLDASRLAEQSPIRDFTDLIQGQSAAVTVLPTTGTVGTGSSIRVRGITSVTQTNKPLIYVDGVRADDSSLGLSVGGAQPTRLTDINPHDIDRIEIVKGAAATTLYGTEASNGVVQIFTKRGRSGPARWTAFMEQGVERLATNRFPGRLWPEFVGPTGYRAHDPKDIVRSGRTQNYQLSVGGGAETLSYYVSGGFQRQEGSVTPEVNWMNQGFTRVNLNAVLHPTLSVGVSTGYVNSDLRLPDNDNALHGVYSQVVSGIPYTADETRPWGERWGSHEINKTIETTQGINRFTGGVKVDHQLTDAIAQNLTLGLDWYGQLDERYIPYGFEGSGNNLGAKNSRQRRMVQTTLDYRAGLSHEFSSDFTTALSGGFQANFSRDHRTQSSGQEYPAPGLRTVGATTITQGTETWINETNAGFFSQVELGMLDRLFVTTGVRFDGNSAFGEDFPFQAYPKVSVAYSISDEAFWPTNIASTMKLRGAYGTAGRAPAQFAADRTFSPIASEDGQPAVTPWNVGDPDLGPETSTELELGFDAGMWNDRLGLEFTYYNQVTKDALVYKRFPPSQGFDRTQLANVGEIKNWGWEVGLRGLIFASESVDWEANFQLSRQNNEVTSLGGEPDFSGGNGTRVVEGYPATGKWTRVVDYWDPDTRRHVGVDTVVYRGDATPKWRGSLSSSVRLFEDVTVSAMGEFAAGMVGINFARGWAIGKLTGDEYLALLERPSGAPTAAADSLLDMWNVVSNAGWVEKADWLKIRDISISWRLPDGWMSPARLRDTTLRLSGRNLFMWAPHWTGPDPEVKYGGHGDLNIGYDFNTMPIARRFTLAIRTGW